MNPAVSQTMTPRVSPLKFALRFAVLFAVLMGSFEWSRGTAFERVIVEDGVIVPTAALIRVVTPSEGVQQAGRTLATSPGDPRPVKLNVTRGCEGVELMAMLAAAVLAFPTSGKRRLSGLLHGTAIVYALSILRLAILFYALHHAPQSWEVMHGLLLPLVPIVLIALYFLYWSGPAPRPAVAG